MNKTDSKRGPICRDWLGRLLGRAKVLLRETNICGFSIGFQHSAFTFAQEANMHDNKFTNYKVPSGLLVLFLEKALTLIHMETHLNDVSVIW